MANIPVSYYWVTEVSMALESKTKRATEAFIEMHGIKTFQLEGKDCIKSTDLPKITKGIENARKESRLLVPVTFASKELGMTEEDYLLKILSKGARPVVVDGIKYVEKSAYLSVGGELLKAEKREENTDQDSLDF